MLSLLIILFVVLLLALAFIVWPLRHTPKQALIASLVLSVLSVSMYAYWGGLPAMQEAKENKARQTLARLALKELKTPQAVIQRLKQTLNDKPNSAKGWYLLGRLYSSQGEFLHAKNSLLKAYALDDKDLLIRVTLMQALYMTNKQTINAQIQVLLDSILKDDDDQPDAINFMAIDAYNHHEYQKAARLLQRLLALLPQGSQEHDSVLKTIARLQKQV